MNTRSIFRTTWKQNVTKVTFPPNKRTSRGKVMRGGGETSLQADDKLNIWRVRM